MQRYWLDANVLIEAHRRSYPIGIVVSFWTWLGGQVENSVVVCPRRVYQELAEQEDHKDELSVWVQNRRNKGLCIMPSKEVTAQVGHILEFVFANYQAPQAYDFSKGGDVWVVAHALDDSGTVVTQESGLRPQARKVRIPDVCKHFHVKCIDTLQMLKELGAKF